MNGYKYPRTPHLPWSPGRTNDDRVLGSTEHLYGKKVVLTEKMDGECTTITRTGSHARSLSSGSHPSRTRVRALQGRVGCSLGNLRLCGENVFARHSVSYTNLPGYFLLFSVWEKGTCLSWDDTKDFAALLEIPTVPELATCIWTPEIERKQRATAPTVSACGPIAEGYVIRLAGSFQHEDFARSVAKYVRADHVQAGPHWMHQEMTLNRLG